MSWKQLIGLVALVVVLVVCEQSVDAGYIDFDPMAPGKQTASWNEPTTIMVFIPAGLAGADRMNFEMGVNSVVDCLEMISVQFKNGEPEMVGDPPQLPMNTVDVNIKNLNPPPFGVASPGAIHQPGQDHGRIVDGTIDIDPTALGHAAVAASFMKNLGAHEFGHILGLDDKPRQSGERTTVMDPDFKLIFNDQGQVIRADPFVELSQSEKMKLKEHYSVVPEPASFLLLALGTVGMMTFRTCSRRKRVRIAGRRDG